MLKALRKCKQHQIVCKEQMVDRAISNSDALISQGWQPQLKGTHEPPFGYAVIGSQKLIYVIPQKGKIYVR